MSDQSPHPEADPRVQERIRSSFERQGLMSHLGAQLTQVAAGQVSITLAHRDEVTQQHGYIHAGATSAIADSAGGYAALTMFPDESEVLSVEYKLNLLAPAIGQSITAVGTVVKSGRTLTVCRLEVFAQDDTKRTLVAVGQQTLIRVEARQPD